MPSLSGLFNIVILLGAFQGFIISALLFTTRENKPGSRRLAVLILLISLASLDIYLLEHGMPGWSQGFLIFAAVTPLIVVMPVGPLIYLYVRSFSAQEVKLKKGEWLHFAPTLIDVAPNLLAVFYVGGLALGAFPRHDQPWIRVFDFLNTYSDIPRWLSVTIYLFLSLRILARGNVESRNYSWLRQFVLAFLTFQGVWLLHLIPYILPNYQNSLMEMVGWYPVYIPLAVLIYWLGIKGYLVSQQSQRRSASVMNLSSQTIQATLSALRKAMSEDRLFLDPLLNLDCMVHHIGMSQKIVSAVLNQHMGKSFNEFVNEYRIEEFKKMIQESGYRNLTIAGLALECGFNSQPTFQRTFKHFTGLSPRAYISHQASGQISA